MVTVMSESMPSGMGMPLLPQWLRIVWALALAAVVVLHTWHAATMPGQPRQWHAGHTIMAAAMAAMYLLPARGHPQLYRAGFAFFALFTLAMAAVGLRLRRREGVANPLWAATTIDMLAMTYMLIPATARPPGLNWVFVTYLAAQTVAWAAGWWERVPVLTPTPTADSAPAPAGAPGGQDRAALLVSDPRSGARQTTITAGLPGRVGLPAHCTPSIRVTLAVMAASMGYMLAIM